MSDQILFVRSTRCLNCGAIHTTSELMAVDIHSTHGRHLFPAKQYRSELGLDKVSPETRLTPICHSCADAIAQPTLSDRESYTRWQDTLRRKREELKPTTINTHTHKPSTSRDNLEDII